MFGDEPRVLPGGHPDPVPRCVRGWLAGLAQDPRDLLEAIPDALLLVDGAGRIAYANGQAHRLLGYPPDALLGLTLDCLLPDRFRQRHAVQMAGYFADPDVRPLAAGRDLVALRRDGSELPVVIGLSPHPTADGLLVAASLRDVSALQEMQAELRDRVCELETLKSCGPKTLCSARNLASITGVKS